MSKWASFLLVLLSLQACQNKQADIQIAIAANYVPVFEELKKRFEAHHDISLAISAASSGTLATQIRNGAPFDLFFSADSIFPQQLALEGLGAHTARLFVYGKMVIWTKKELNEEKLIQLLHEDKNLKIAIAEPHLAPYGAIASNWLDAAQQWKKWEKRLIRGSNVGQVNQYIRSGVVDIAFTAASSKHMKGLAGQCCWVEVEVEAIPHYLLQLRSGEKISRFMMFLQSEEAQGILERMGYELPDN